MDDTGKTTAQRRVAVCIDTRDGGGRKRLHGVVQHARQADWRMMLVRSGGSEAAREVERLRPHGVIAYIAGPDLVATAKRLRIPLVDTAWNAGAVTGFTTLDNDAVGRLAAEHFTGAGFRHFAYCGVSGQEVSERRRERFAIHLARHQGRLTAFAQAVSEGESRMTALQNWLKRLPKPIGVLCFDDKLGERVLAACRWAGLEVPGQVAVLGIGDDELMCEVSWPSLSSVSVPTWRLGLEAATMLDRAMRRQPVGERVRLVAPTGIAIRTSTDVVAVDDPLIRSATALIRERGCSLGVKQLAHALGISRRTLDRHFARLLGRTVHDVIALERMRKARNLLTSGEQTVASVATACGFATAASFSRTFHAHTGRWPTAFRQEVRER